MSANSPTDPQRLGKYELRERLGRGGMAEVWKAYDTQLERYVAIKLLHADLQNDPEFITRFSREAQVIASLHHPNIVQIHDFQTSRLLESDNTVAYMVMDYVEGQTLADYIRNTSRIGMFPSEASIVALFTSISRAIEYAHQHGMIHRDIKPANILLDQRNTKQNPMGEPVLTDFGIAKLIGTASGTASGMWIGTPLYISPEQALGHPGNERSDIYSLGVILYEICTGAQPFRGENISALMMQHINSVPISPVLINPNISPLVSMVILRGLAKNPEDRFNSAPAMAASLAEACNMPVPEDMRSSLSSEDVISRPAYRSSIHPNLLSDMRSSSSSLPAIRSVQGIPTTPLFNTPGGSSLTDSVQPSQTLKPLISPSNVTPVTHSSPLAPQGQRRSLLFWLIPLIVIGLLLSSLGTLYWLTHIRTVPVLSTKPIVGYAFFVSSGEGSEESNQGISDQILIDLKNIPPPAPAKSYYAWLLSDENNPLAPSILLGKLTVIQGAVHLLYAGDPHHTNLLANTSRFLITEEDADISPISPTPDKSAWHYFSELPQTGNPTDMMHASILTHLRHLLADEDSLKAAGLPGGLDMWLFRNTEKVFEWSGFTRDFWEERNAAGVHNQLVRMLDYLDGAKKVSQDISSGYILLVNPRLASFALLGSDTMNMETSGYLSQVDSHLHALAQSPGLSKDKQALAAQIDQEINNVRNWLEQVHMLAVQLVNMPVEQLLTRDSLLTLNNMITLTRYAYIGQINADTNQIQGGVVQIHDNIQHLATYDIAEYQSH